MASRGTIFAEIVLRRIPKPEDAATDGLTFVLSATRAIARAFQEYLHLITGLTLPELVSFEAQVQQNLGGRPDIVASTADGRQLLFIENKFWAGLTENQPLNYLEDLKTHSGDKEASALVFVCPHRAFPIYSHEIRRRVEDRLSPEVVREHPLVFKFGDRLALVVLTWQILLEVIGNAASEASDRQLVEDIAQLRGLVEQVDAKNAFLPLRSTELAAEFGKRWSQFNRIQWDLITVLTREPYSMGYYQNSNRVALGGGGKWDVWVCLELDLWATYGRTPFWLIFQKWTPHYQSARLALHKWLSADPPNAMECKLWNSDCLCIPLVPRLGVCKDDVLRDLATQVAEVREALFRLEESMGTDNDQAGITRNLDKELEAKSPLQVDSSPVLFKHKGTGQL